MEQFSPLTCDRTGCWESSDHRRDRRREIKEAKFGFLKHNPTVPASGPVRITEKPLKTLCFTVKSTHHAGLLGRQGKYSRIRSWLSSKRISHSSTPTDSTTEPKFVPRTYGCFFCYSMDERVKQVCVQQSHFVRRCKQSLDELRSRRGMCASAQCKYLTFLGFCIHKVSRTNALKITRDNSTINPLER